jgi:HTH-type transcriptional regulator/antitoxin HigA
MNVKPIKSKKSYQEALDRIDIIFDSGPGTPQGDELEILSILIDHYEKEHFPVDFPDPVEAIKFRMEQLGMKQKDLADMVGNKSRVSEILNRKRKLTLDMVRKISESLSIPTEVLIREY